MKIFDLLFKILFYYIFLIPYILEPVINGFLEYVIIVILIIILAYSIKFISDLNTKHINIKFYFQTLFILWFIFMVFKLLIVTLCLLFPGLFLQPDTLGGFAHYSKNQFYRQIQHLMGNINIITFMISCILIYFAIKKDILKNLNVYKFSNRQLIFGVVCQFYLTKVSIIAIYILFIIYDIFLMYQ